MDLKNRGTIRGSNRTRGATRLGGWLFAVVVLSGLLTSCGADNADTVSETSATGPAMDAASDAIEVEPPEEPAALTAGSGSGPSLGGGVTPSQNEPLEIGRDIIYTADLVVSVEDLTRAGQRATEVVADLGGLLFGQETVSAGTATSTYSFRVRPADFQAALSGLSSIGEVRNQVISTEDVTGAVVDLESRIATSEASVDRLRDLLSDAASIEVVAQLEQQLLERETTLEVLRGQLRSLRDQVDLATINLTLTEALARPEVAFAISSYGGHDDGVACPGGNQQAEVGDDVTLCFEIVNTGEAPLSQIELRDTALDIETADLIVVYGDLGTQLLPGQAVLLAYETDVQRTLRLRTRVTASPTTVDGEAIAARALQSNSDFILTVRARDGLPGFTDALRGGWNVLTGLIQVIVLIIGALIPFLWILLVAWLIWRWLRRRSDARRSTAASGLAKDREAEQRDLEQSATAAEGAVPPAKTVPPPPAPK